MATWYKDVYSTNVLQVGYDTEHHDLLIKWAKGGKTSAYAGVPEELAMQLSMAPSVGSMLYTDVKPYYTHRYV